MQFDSLAVGDATYDVFLKTHQAVVRRDLDPVQAKLVINYGDKMIADELTYVSGGNASNNAVGLARLGKKVTFYNLSGDDSNRAKIIDSLKAEGVDTSAMVALPGKKSNLAMIIDFEDEKTEFIYHDKHEYEVTGSLAVAPYLYLSSVGAIYEQFFYNLAAFVKEHQIKLVFNPASHQLLDPIAKSEPILKAATMVFMNKEEAARLLDKEKQLGQAVATLAGQKTNVQLQSIVKAMLDQFATYGAPYVAITDGPAGSYSFDGQTHRYIGIWDDFPVVERTGCGDAYASGFMAAVMNGLDAAEAMRWGTFNGGSVVGQIGPQAGLLKLSEMQPYLNQNPGFQPVVI